MSTLGRKAIKRTLERLKKKGMAGIDEYLSLTGKLISQREKMGKQAHALLDMIIGRSHPMISALIQYIQALEDYSLELDEAWDKLLKSAKKAQKGTPKPVEKKKRTSYIG